MKWPSKCPFTWVSAQDKTSLDPFYTIFEWLRQQVDHATKRLPVHDTWDSSRKKLMIASIDFCEYLVPLIQWLTPGICRRINGKSLYTVFQIPNQSTSYITSMFLSELSDARKGYWAEKLGIHTEEYKKILDNYTVGIRTIIELWQNILETYRSKYGTWPTPQQIASYREFIMNFSHHMWASPGFFSIAIAQHIIEVPKGWFALDNCDQPYIIFRCLEKLHNEYRHLSDEPANQLRQKLTGASCPALPKIREVAEVCCKVLEECYEYTLTK